MRKRAHACVRACRENPGGGGMHTLKCSAQRQPGNSCGCEAAEQHVSALLPPELRLRKAPAAAHPEIEKHPGKTRLLYVQPALKICS